MDTLHDETDVAAFALPEQSAFEAALDASDREVEAGRTVPLGPVLASMRATAERIRRERAQQGAATPPG
jgi:hypothetical protein